jgi:16S rRNA C967 or C1407 C5-methylase (RsmB/RsmF family)
MCAAPGSKTAQLIEALSNEGGIPCMSRLETIS